MTPFLLPPGVLNPTAVTNVGGKNLQLRHASIAGLGVGCGTDQYPLTNVHMRLVSRIRMRVGN
jgi:hypothetical protein